VFENTCLTITNRGKQHFVSQVEKIEAAEKLMLRPIVKDMEVGSQIDITGSYLPQGTRLSIDLGDSSLLSIHTLARTERLGDQVAVAQYQIPTAIKRRCEVSCDLPEGSSLAISLGLSERRPDRSDVAEIASGLLELVGLPGLETKSVTCERLVVITPRRIVLESEARPVSAPRAWKPKTPGEKSDFAHQGRP
jgi:hypothetical protein